MSKNIIDSFTSFVGKYGNEATVVANALTSLLDAVRPNSAVTEDVKAAISVLQTAAGNIANSASPVPVVINKDDVEAAVAAVLPDMVAVEVAKQLAARAPASENPTPAPEPSGDTGATN